MAKSLGIIKGEENGKISKEIEKENRRYYFY